MLRFLPILLFQPLFLLPLTLRAQDIDPEEVSRAIDQGVRYLKSKQRPEGNWDDVAGQRTGTTSLAVIALLSAGVSKDDPAIVKAMQYLRLFRVGPNFNQNYAISLQTMAFALCDPERDRPLIRENVRQIEEHQTFDGSPSNGGWTYVYTGRKAGQHGSDNSNAQFAMLGLYEAERVGVPVKKETWDRALAYWERSQNANGSWGYTPTDNGSNGVRSSMVCAGLSSLMIAAGMTERAGATVRGNQIFCGLPAASATQERIRAGFGWLERNFSVSENRSGGGGSDNHYLLYYLYGLERVGRMGAHRFIGKNDWYREGTAFLLRRKGEDNSSWHEGGGGDVVGTSFALLFLSRGRRPVLMSKVEFGNDKSWNAHPNDVDHLTRFIEKRWEIDLTWQIITLDAASVEDLLQTPVLYLCGTQSPLPRDPTRQEEYVQKLRGYLDRGGFLFAEAQPNDVSFDKGFRELMRRVLPEDGYELRLLGTEHPVWQAEITVEPDQVRPIEGIDFGCRTSVVFCPVTPNKADGGGKGNRPSLSCLWEVAQLVDRGTPYHEAVQRQIDAGLGIGVNILAYATNREMKTKDKKMAEAAFQVLSNIEQRRGRIFMGICEVGNGTHSAPRALPNLLQWAGVSLGVQADPRATPVHFGTDDVYDFPIVFLHGRGPFRFTDEERDRIAKYVERGGVIFANSICSSQPFADAFKEEMDAIFGSRPVDPSSTETMKLEPVPRDDALLSDKYGGFPIERLEIRTSQRSPNREMRLVSREAVPELYGIRIDNRWAVVFSPLDVSCALEKTNTLDCKGYTQEAALKLGVNVLLYALGHL